MWRNQLISGAACAGFVFAAAGIASGDTLDVPNAADFSNADNNENPATIDGSTGTIGGDSWRSVPSNVTGNGQHYLYFQGGYDSQNPQDAKPSGGRNPQLLYDGETDNDPAEYDLDPDQDGVQDPTVGDIERLAWDTKKSSASDANDHWFAQITTENTDNSVGTGYYDHLVTFALTDSTNYELDKWNTLEADRDDTSESIGDNEGNRTLEVAVFDQQRVGAKDKSKFPAKTFAEWEAEEGTSDEPDWWDEEIRWGGLVTNSEHNNSDNKFISNLDAVSASFNPGTGTETRTLNLTVPSPSAVGGGMMLLGALGGGALMRRRRKA